MQQYDVVVVGKGNAESAVRAALAAVSRGARAWPCWRRRAKTSPAGNSRFAGGVMRFAYSTVEDLKRVTELTDEEIANSDYGTNREDEFFDDMFRLTQFRTDPTASAKSW